MMKLNMTVLALAVSFAASADTIAWWHFDERDPGTTAPAGTVASDQAPTTYAHVYTIGDNDSMTNLYENSGDYMPTYAKPFRGTAVYDPVSGIARTNNAAMKFRIDRGGSAPDSDKGRAHFGGALKFDGGKDLYQPLYGTSALTVEAFVCTTGGVYNLFAPIVGILGGTSFQSERFALYMRDDGSIAVRFATTANTDPTIWYTSDGRGKATVNDGVWHHVAFTWDGAKASIYVDYALDKKYNDPTSTTNRVYTKTGTIPTYSDTTATWIGGYAYNNNSGGRKFPGLIDEVRVSNVALTPDQFLQMQPLDMDPDEIVRVSFTPDEYGLLLKKDYGNIADTLGPNKQTAVFRKVSDAGSSVCDIETKAGAVMASRFETDTWVEDAASFYQETNDVGKANYVMMQSISKFIRNSDSTMQSYTVELFYKTRNTVRGTTNNRQVLMKFSGDGWFNVLFDAVTSKLLYVSNTDGAAHYDAASENADDGKWHHVAVVVDASEQSMSFYFDYALAKTRTGTLPTIGTGSSFFFAAKDTGNGQWFDGWMDDIRVTRRALTPNEFLTTHPVGTGDASLLALFEQNYDFTCAQYEDFSVTGVGEARTGGNAPTFVKESRGDLYLDGTNGNVKATNEYSVRLNTSRVVFPPSHLFEADTYTVEFVAKFDGIVDANGPVDPASTNLAQALPIMRLVSADSTSNSDYSWYIFRAKNSKDLIQMASGGDYPGWHIPSDSVVDGKWHHYAFTFEPKSGTTDKTSVTLFYDYEKQASGTINTLKKRVADHKLMLGEGTHDQPNIVGEFDAVRFTKGVLDPSQFLGRVKKGFVLILR
ncbi:MAG: laminin G domain-containing protein [Kiritimatiellae bacterium]|nr:laminin G domain-containing protein [Kiritimatiellia bacterium]